MFAEQVEGGGPVGGVGGWRGEVEGEEGVVDGGFLGVGGGFLGWGVWVWGCGGGGVWGGGCGGGGGEEDGVAVSACVLDVRGRRLDVGLRTLPLLCSL